MAGAAHLIGRWPGALLARISLTNVRHMQGIAQVRSFNRMVTLQTGALEEGFLGRNRSLGACRLLFEIGADGVEIRQLRARLALDSGYTSRLLRQLETERLIRTTPSPRDTRVRFVRLTTAGRKELALLNRLSDEAAATLLDPLPEAPRAALLSAMGTVERRAWRSEEHTSELQSLAYLVCRLLLEKKKQKGYEEMYQISRQ